MLSVTTAAELLRELRAKAKLGQEDIAAGLGVTVGTVSQWETGRTSPRSAARARRLDDLLSAGGRLLEAYGFAVSQTPPNAAEIAERLDRHDDEVESLRSQLDGLTVQVSRLAEQVGALSNSTHPPSTGSDQ